MIHIEKYILSELQYSVAITTPTRLNTINLSTRKTTRWNEYYDYIAASLCYIGKHQNMHTTQRNKWRGHFNASPWLDYILKKPLVLTSQKKDKQQNSTLHFLCFGIQQPNPSLTINLALFQYYLILSITFPQKTSQKH